MRIAILGTGAVGRQLGSALVARGHEVRMGGRATPHAAADAWAVQQGARAGAGTFAQVAAWGEVLLSCVSGQHTLAALELAGGENLSGKVLIDLANPLDFSEGFPPSLSVCNTSSLAERIQEAYPEAKVVKTLNTVANELMVDPGRLAGGDHSLFVSGNDAGAKAQVIAWLGEWFGWKDVIDLGDIRTARGTEAWLLLWTRLYGALGTGSFNLKIQRQD